MTSETKFTTLWVYPDGPDEPGVSFNCADGFVSRVVSAVAENNLVDAEVVCAILNERAASPELYEALERALNDARSDGFDHGLSRARGESQ